MRAKTVVLGLVLLAIGGTGVWAQAASLNLPDMPLHDPWIVADAKAGLYRLYTSNIAAVSGTPGLGTMMYTSPDLKAWSPARAVFVAPTDAWFKGGAWAPEVHRLSLIHI